MKPYYDFSKGKRGPVIPLPAGQERITIRLDRDILDYFMDQVERAGGGNYLTDINNVLRDYIDGKRATRELEGTLRRVIRRSCTLQRVPARNGFSALWSVAPVRLCRKFFCKLLKPQESIPSDSDGCLLGAVLIKRQPIYGLLPGACGVQHSGIAMPR